MRRRFLSTLVVLSALAWALPAWAYRLPPEKILQYWAARVGRYGAFEVRGTHTVFDEEGKPHAAAARILFDQRSQFRFDRTPKDGAPLAVISAEAGVLVVEDGVELGPEIAARYDFARLFSLGRRVGTETLDALRATGVMMDSPPVLWLLAELRSMGVAWNATRLSPYGDGEVVYVLGEPYPRSGMEAPEGGGTVLFDNREFTPVELRRSVTAPTGAALLYRAVLSNYKNDILQYFPQTVDLYVGDLLVERFALESARLQPKISAEDFDLGAARKQLLVPETEEIPETPPAPEAAAQEKKP